MAKKKNEDGGGLKVTFSEDEVRGMIAGLNRVGVACREFNLPVALSLDAVAQALIGRLPQDGGG